MRYEKDFRPFVGLFALCACEKDSDTTGKFRIELLTEVRTVEVSLYVAGTQSMVREYSVTNEATIELNAGNYDFRMSGNSSSGLSQSGSFQIMAGHTTKLMWSNVGLDIIYD